MTNLRSLSDLFKAAMKLAAACAFATAIAVTASAQTNTFPTTGNAGAGTTSPDRKLEVLDSGSPQMRLTHTDGSVYTDFQTLSSGNLLISPTGPDTTSTKPISIAADADTFRFYPNADTNLRWSLSTDASGFFHVVQKGDSWASQGTRFSINRSGNVGIGTTSPGAKLDIGAGSAARGSYSDLLIGTGGNNAQMEFYGPTKSSALAHDETLGGLVLYTNGPAWTPSMFIGNGGNVGIGTTSPVYSLDVNGGVNGFRAKAATTSSSDAIATFENSGGVQAIVRGNGNIGIGNTSPTEKLHVTGNGKFTGNLTVDGTVNAKYQDLAEWVPSSEQLASGTVVVLDTTKSNQVVSSTTGYDTRVAGVISAQPGITLGESGEGKVLVATTGRVRVKVDASRGAIQIGDLLVTSDVLGVAMKSEAVNLGGVQIHRPGTIIGKALEPLAKGSGEILVLLSLQ